ncbi:MAG: dipeptidase [Candidatus Desulforudis sp.]|nr:dipeptidase [Desulforudis sp.]
MPNRGATGSALDNWTVVDAHCDTLTVILDKGRPFCLETEEGHLDLPRLKRGGVKVQFFAAFVHPRYRGGYLRRTLALIDAFHREVVSTPEVLVVLGDNDLERVADGGSDRVAAVLAVEGGEALESSTAVLRMLYHLGLRCLGLTWNGRNELADGVGETGSRGGLTAFGRAVVSEMNRLGMVVDLAHLGERGFLDVLEVSEKPVIVSHANARALCDHPRNLTDVQIRALSERGGVVGVTFVPDFVDSAEPSRDKLLDHIEHVVQTGGPDCVGLGSDFDGFGGRLRGLEHAGLVGELGPALLDRGYSADDVAKIMGGNLLRVLKQVL